MLEIKGKKATAICYAKVIEDEAVEQIKRMCDYELTEGSSVRIMPDVHSGKGCTIGTTMTIKDKACSNIVGVILDVVCLQLNFKIKKLILKNLIRFVTLSHQVKMYGTVELKDLI
jgi:tRNA-splicing ligase RtcB